MHDISSGSFQQFRGSRAGHGPCISIRKERKGLAYCLQQHLPGKFQGARWLLDTSKLSTYCHVKVQYRARRRVRRHPHRAQPALRQERRWLRRHVRSVPQEVRRRQSLFSDPFIPLVSSRPHVCPTVNHNCCCHGKLLTACFAYCPHLLGCALKLPTRR